MLATRMRKRLAKEEEETGRIYESA